MRRILLFIASTAFLFLFVNLSDASANDHYAISGTYDLEFNCTRNCNGIYNHVMDIGDIAYDNKDLAGRGYVKYNDSYTWDLIGVTDEGKVYFEITYTGLRPGYKVCMSGEIHSDGSISGVAVSSLREEFTWKADKTIEHFTSTKVYKKTTPNSEVVVAKKTTPEDEVVVAKRTSYNDVDRFVGVGGGGRTYVSYVNNSGRSAVIMTPDNNRPLDGDLYFRANLYDNDYDSVLWSISNGACGDENYIMMGNYYGHHNDYYWQEGEEGKYEFYVTANVTSWPSGPYCFSFDPKEDYNEEEISLSRTFYVRTY